MKQSAGPSIEVSGLELTYRPQGAPVHALRGVDLAIPSGQIAAILGPSGCGKSTLLHLLAGLLTPTAGTVRIGDVDVHELTLDGAARWRRRNTGIVHQFFNLLPTLSVVHNVATPLLLEGQPLRRVRGRAEDLLDQLGVGHRRGHAVDQLSGGEMQRVAVARALIANPPLLLADEPTGNLDSRNSHQILTLLERLADERGITMVIVTHDLGITSHASRVITMLDGEIEDDSQHVRVSPAPASATDCVP